MKTRLSELTQVERYGLGQIGRVRRSRTKWEPNLGLMRLREIEKIIKSRHGNVIPETDDGDLYIKAAALTLTKQNMRDWCAYWAPWAGPEVLGPIEAEARKHRYMLTADGVAGLLMVTMAERDRLKLKTVGACDISAAERKAIVKSRKRERDRKRQAQKRKDENRKDRASYEAESLSTLKPWVTEGISRRTWERRRVAGVSRVECSSLESDRLATPSKTGEPVASTCSVQKSTGEAGAGGLGAMPPTGFQGAAPHGSDDTEAVKTRMKCGKIYTFGERNIAEMMMARSNRSH